MTVPGPSAGGPGRLAVAAGAGRAGVEHAGDVGVVHQGQGLTLGLEAGDDLRAVHAGLDDLQGDLALDRLGLLRHEDGAHAALADLLQELVRADDRAGAFAEGDSGRLRPGHDRVGPRGPHGSGRPVQETAGFAVNLEKVPHLLLELGIPAAGFADVAVPLLRRQLADGMQKQFTGFLQVCWHGNTSLSVRHLQCGFEVRFVRRKQKKPT